MTRTFGLLTRLTITTGIVALAARTLQGAAPGPMRDAQVVTTQTAAAHDRSARLDSQRDMVTDMRPDMRRLLPPRDDAGFELAMQSRQQPPIVLPKITTPAGSGTVEQRKMGPKSGVSLVASFDGLGVGFSGPQGTAFVRNPSDNSLAVGPDHIVQIVNSRMAIFTKKSKLYATTGRVLYGPVPTNTIFRNFTGQCDTRLSGDAVVRYDQLANRWLFVPPVFQRGPVRPDQIAAPKVGDPAQLSVPGRADQPGAAAALFVPPPPPPPDSNAPPPGRGRAGRPGGTGRSGEAPAKPEGPYSMCYAVSTSSDPTGSYYRYEFLRPLFPDYPRPAVWPDGYYVPTSTSDNRISDSVATQKHACVADRARMLRGEPATEQCLIVENVNFLNNTDVDGTRPPPPGAPNIMTAAGGRQLDKNVASTRRATSSWRVSRVAT